MNKVATLNKKGLNFGCNYTDGYWAWFESNEVSEQAYSPSSLSEAIDKAYKQVKDNNPWLFERN